MAAKTLLSHSKKPLTRNFRESIHMELLEKTNSLRSREIGFSDFFVRVKIVALHPPSQR